MRYGGMEIGNEARTLAYIRAGLLGDSRVHARDCACDVLEDEYGPFVDPVTDEAPWYTSARAESEDFLGLLIDRIELTSPWARSVTARGGSGSVLGPQRLRGRVVSVTGNLYAASPEAMDYGKRWLSEVLRDCNSLDGIGDLCLMPECPEDETVNMFRTLKRAALIDGPTEVLYPGVDPCLLTGVRFQLATEVGWLFQDAEMCMDNVTVAGAAETCILSTEEWIGDATARITIVAGAPDRVENLRVTATPTINSVCPPAGVATPCSDFWVNGLRPGTQLVIDGAARTVQVEEVTSGRVVGGLEVVTMVDGGPFDWIDVGACSQMCCVVDGSAATLNANTKATIESFPRET